MDSLHSISCPTNKEQKSTDLPLLILIPASFGCGRYAEYLLKDKNGSSTLEITIEEPIHDLGVSRNLRIKLYYVITGFFT